MDANKRRSIRASAIGVHRRLSAVQFFCGLFALAAAAAFAQEPPALAPIARIAVKPDPLAIAAPAGTHDPFALAGPQGAILGERTGAFEAWIWPVKLLSSFAITADLADYPVPIDLAPQAATIEVAPAATTITYSHAAFTLRQRMFAPRQGDAGAVVLFEINSIRPLTLTFRFRPDMLRMWPAPNSGRPSAEWVQRGAGGYYILHTDDPGFSAAIAMPQAQPGVLAPYQERPQTHPLELKLAFDPGKDAGLEFPLIFTLGNSQTDYAARLGALCSALPRFYAETQSYWAHFFDTRLTAETPDPQFDRALRWAEISTDQGRVRLRGETGLVAGYSESGDSARPGFGWFFGRDALWTSYAINSYGDFALTRDVLDFLIRRQRPDGKIMHEFSQTADRVDWPSLPYLYASADATPLLVMAVDDYVRTSGDVGFLRSHWDAVRRAYAFTRAHDSDGDGIYENTEGTGWVESWPGGMPHQEIYLAALDQQSADAMSRLAALLGDRALAASARLQAAKIHAALEAEYDDKERGMYAFSRNPDGTLDRTATIYPAVAWWTGTLALANPAAMLSRWASPEFSTDWGTRDISSRTPFYDPISYHQGSVWPLFTGWVSLAEYRAGRPLAAYAHLMQNAGLTWAQDLGSVTELLSGEFFQPLGRSSSHQIWSSAMVFTPALRGLFGLDWDAPHHTLRVAPHLPASWDLARLRHVPLGDARVDLEFARAGGRLIVRARAAAPAAWCLASQDAPRGEDCAAPAAAEHEISFPLPPAELEIPHGLPLAGARTGQLKAVAERRSTAAYEIDLAAPGGSEYELPVRLNRPGIAASGGELKNGRLRIRFPQGPGYQSLTVRFSW
jgi:hypothetical protein